MADEINSCDLLDGGITKPCGTNMGSMSEFYILDKESIDEITTSEAGLIDSITTISSRVFFKFVFPKETGFFTEKTTTQGGVDFTAQDIQILIPKREVEKRNTILLLSGNKDLIIVCKDGNGNLNLFGQTNGMNLVTNDSGTGTKKADFNGYTLNFHGDEPYPANFVDADAFADVIA